MYNHIYIYVYMYVDAETGNDKEPHVKIAPEGDTTVLSLVFEYLYTYG